MADKSISHPEQRDAPLSAAVHQRDVEQVAGAVAGVTPHGVLPEMHRDIAEPRPAAG